MDSQQRNGFQEAVHKWKIKHHHIEIDLLLLWVYYLLPWQLPLSLLSRQSPTGMWLLSWFTSLNLSHEAEWLRGKVLEIWWLHISYQPDPFPSSREEGPYNKRNITNRLLFSPEKGMKLFSESWGSTWHPSQADLPLQEIHGFVIKKQRQIDLLWAESFPKECTRNHCIKRNDLCKRPQFWVRRCRVALHDPVCSSCLSKALGTFSMPV